MCQGVPARKVTRDPESGLLYIDGELIKSRLFVLPPMTPRNAKRAGRPKKSHVLARHANRELVEEDD